MTKILTLCLDAELLAAVEARAARLGLDRANYVRSLIEEDLEDGTAVPARKFASEDLVGMYEGSGQSADNALVRNRLRKSDGGRET
ncbi:MAG: hypothetical protein KA004_13740 [Verrucomicrobiales bacterium]|nr:hypothetical protein [Verrucomicrobiales bacterium]